MTRTARRQRAHALKGGMIFKSPYGSAIALSALALALSACGGGEAEAEAVETTVQEAAEEVTPAAEASPTTPAETTDEAETAEPETSPVPEGSLAGSEMALGSPDAPLTITEFASVTCPGCAGFHATHFPAIKEQLVDTGQVRFVYKEFPTPPVRLSQAGFILARCSATEAGSEAYFAMIDALYKTQRSWITSDNPGESLRNIAAQAGIGEDEFESCFERQDIRDAIVSSIEEGRDLGLTGTPSFVVEGQTLRLSGTTEEVIDQIKAEIAKRQ